MENETEEVVEASIGILYEKHAWVSLRVEEEHIRGARRRHRHHRLVATASLAA